MRVVDGNRPFFGGIEAGGTKFVCAVGSGPEDVVEVIRFPTTQPEATLGKAIAFFQKHAAQRALDAIGVAAFGPLDPNPDSPTFGTITSTPKPGWANVDVVSALGQVFDVPVSFDTDVNGAALAEARWGAAQGLNTFVYLTVGTGIGGGGVVRGNLMHGLVHPEMGHMRVPHDWDADPFPGRCPYHGDCLEGLASGPAIGERWNRPADELADDHPAWKLEARYLALALANIVLVVSPQRIILGGGVMQRGTLFPLIRKQVQELLNGYVQAKEIVDSVDSYIVPPALENQAGVLGAFALAERALRG